MKSTIVLSRKSHSIRQCGTFSIGTPSITVKYLRHIVFWKQIDPKCSFAMDIICGSDLSDPKYLYRYGEYISKNEIETAKFISELPEETVRMMADVYTEGFRKGFVLGNKDLTKKSTVNIRFKLGFERVVKQAIENFQAMGLAPTIYRSGASVLTKRGASRNGYFGGIPNKQFDYDHKDDQMYFWTSITWSADLRS